MQNCLKLLPNVYIYTVLLSKLLPHCMVLWKKLLARDTLLGEYFNFTLPLALTIHPLDLVSLREDIIFLNNAYLIFIQKNKKFFSAIYHAVFTV